VRQRLVQRQPQRRQGDMPSSKAEQRKHRIPSDPLARFLFQTVKSIKATHLVHPIDRSMHATEAQTIRTVHRGIQQQPRDGMGSVRRAACRGEGRQPDSASVPAVRPGRRRERRQLSGRARTPAAGDRTHRGRVRYRGKGCPPAGPGNLVRGPSCVVAVALSSPSLFR
jgi:hypothetical protein